MCGFIGNVGGAIDPGQLARGLAALRHRGPDAEGQATVSGPGAICNLAFARLAIIDLSPLGGQPMESPDGRYTLVFNGEIFNFLALRAELEQRGHSFRSHSDTEVLLHGWMEWGTGVLPKLRGFFAIAVFDRQDGSLTLARDHLGIKPLYVAERGGNLAFASEIRALLAAGLAERRLDPDGLSSYLAFGSVSEPWTILAGVRALPPGTWLRWTATGQERGQFWTLPVAGPRLELRFEEAVERVRAVLRESVRLRLVADVPVGVFLSGGIDSSVITALAAAESRTPVQTFTVSFNEAAADESRYAKMVADRFGCQHHTLLLDSNRAVDEIDAAVAGVDQPSIDGINTWFVSKLTRAAGITVALSGLGGDELFAGYSHFRRISRLLRAGAFAPGASLRWVEAQVARLGGFRLPNSVAKSLAVLAQQGDLLGVYAVLRSVFTRGQRMALFGDSQRLRSYVESAAEAPDLAGLHPVTALSALELGNYMRNTLLRDGDVMSMAHGLEVRFPLLAHEVVELVLSLPPELKLGGECNKALLAAVVPDLPLAAIDRPKMGFSLPFDDWFRGPLRGWMEQRLFSGELTRSGLVRQEPLHALWKGFLSGSRYVSSSRVWSLAVLAEWTQRHGIPLAPA